MTTSAPPVVALVSWPTLVPQSGQTWRNRHTNAHATIIENRPHRGAENESAIIYTYDPAKGEKHHQRMGAVLFCANFLTAPAGGGA